MNNRILRVLGIRSFLFLWIAELFSQFGFNMMSFILIVVAYSVSKSSTAVSAVVLSFIIPSVILGLVAGIYVDRWNKKKVLFTVNIIRALLLLGLAYFHNSLGLILLLSFLISVATQFFIPAESPMIPLVVKKSLLLQANALFGIGIYSSLLIAYALSGPFLILLGSKNTFFLLSAFFLIAAVFILMIDVTPKDSENIPVSESIDLQATFFHSVKQLIKTISRTREIYHSLFLLTLSQTIILIIAVVGPGYVNQVLDIPINRFPILFITPAALGMVVGSIVLTNFLHLGGREKSVTIGVLLSSLTFILLPFGAKVSSGPLIHVVNSYLPRILAINILHIMVFLAFILGVSNALVFIPSNTFLQEKTSEKFRGKVYGALNSLTGIFSILPIILVGWLSDVFGVVKVISGIGIAILIVGVARLFI